MISQKVYMNSRLLESTRPNMAERNRKITKKKNGRRSSTSGCSFWNSSMYPLEKMAIRLPMMPAISTMITAKLSMAMSAATLIP